MTDLHTRVRMHADPRIRTRPEPHKGRKTSKSVDRGVSVLEYCSRVWEALDTPYSLSCYLLARNGEWEQLVRKSVLPADFLWPVDFYKAYQAVKLASKYPYFDTGIDITAVAYQKFIQAEVQCLETNRRFRDVDVSSLDGRLRSVIFDRMQRKIASILGDVPALEDLDFSFGPGASFGVRGDTSVFRKVELTALECTHTLVPLLPDFLGEFPGWIDTSAKASVRLVQGSELCTVPKDATTERSICIEPNLNGLGQKGIGLYLRNRLLRYGVDLTDQSTNQRLAGLAFSQGLATVDFASASDTIAYTLVWNLLPPDWAALLDHFRCPRFTINGKWYNFQKFSSMGNAYTFELETLIFYAMASAVCEELGIFALPGENLAVYGDDVIIPRESFDLFAEVSEYCGFTLNDKKSFSGGAFFESCGHDYFQGHLVTPLRLKERIYEAEQYYLAANNLVRIAERLTALGGFDCCRPACEALASCHWWIRRQTHGGWLVFGPATPPDIDGYHDLIDTHFHAPWDFVTPRIGTFGYRFKRLALVPNHVLPPRWLDADGDPIPSHQRDFESTGYALYQARYFVPPINGWLTNDSEPTASWKGYTVRGNVRRKTVWSWSSDWDQSPLAWMFYSRPD